MYEDEGLIPSNQKELWNVLRPLFHRAEHVLRLPLETKEEALANPFREGLEMLRYHGVSSGFDFGPEFLQTGKDLIEEVAWFLRNEKFTPEFAYQWGRFMFCYGYMSAHLFDDSDPVRAHRYGQKGGLKRSKEDQKRWVSHVIVMLIDKGISRIKAEEKTFEYIQKLLAQDSLPSGYERAFLKAIINKHHLKVTYRRDRLTTEEMRKFVRQGKEGIPPIPTSFKSRTHSGYEDFQIHLIA